MNALRYMSVCLPLVLAACGGGSSNSDPDVNPRTQTPDYSRLNQAELNPAPLRQASTTELELLVKNGLRLSLHNSNNDQLIRSMALAGAVNESADSSSGNYSGTNVQVSGVDETDFVKYDGEHIYLATPVEYVEATPHSSLKIIATEPATGEITEVGKVSLETSEWGSVSELYLVDNAQEQTTAVATLRRSWSFITFNDTLADDSLVDERASLLWHYPTESGIEVTLYDVANPALPTEAWSIALDGDLLGSRKIGNMLYLVSSFIPSMLPLDYTATSLEKRVANEDLIKQTSVTQLLPTYRINEGAKQTLSSANQCLIAENADSNTGHLNLVNITAIDLASRQLVESICVNTLVQGIYTSTNNIYLGGSSDYFTGESADSVSVIHKFSLGAQGVDYEATGAVKGSLGWSSPSFRMDEYQNDLRVVTTTRNENWVPEHYLTVLREVPGDQTLTPLAQIPNNTRPEAIGKPNEDIFAVRFDGEKAYIVTFERIDPLYVVDLSNPADPKLAGELEIPGFSTYLHPVGDDYLFSVGQDADITGMATGVKVSLFDIRDITQPQLVNTMTFGQYGSYSEAIYDHRALTFLRASDDQLRITLPITLYSGLGGEDFTFSRWQSSGLHQFEINGLASASANLSHAGSLTAEDSSTSPYPQWHGSGRGILHDDAVFYVHGPLVVGGLWPEAKE